MQIKTLRLLLTPVRMPKVKEATMTKRRMGFRKEKPRSLLVGLQTDAATMESSVKNSEQTKNIAHLYQYLASA